MRITFNEEKDFTLAMKEYTEKKLRKVPEKFNLNNPEIRVNLSRESQNFELKVSLEYDSGIRRKVFVKKEAPDFYALVDEVEATIARTVRKENEKILSKKRKQAYKENQEQLKALELEEKELADETEE